MDFPVIVIKRLQPIPHLLKQWREYDAAGGADLTRAPSIRSVMVPSPVGLHEDAVDLFEADFPVPISDGFEQGPDTQVAHAPQDAFA